MALAQDTQGPQFALSTKDKCLFILVLGTISMCVYFSLQLPTKRLNLCLLMFLWTRINHVNLTSIPCWMFSTVVIMNLDLIKSYTEPQFNAVLVINNPRHHLNSVLYLIIQDGCFHEGNITLSGVLIGIT